MKHKGLIAYLVLIALISGGFIAVVKSAGTSGYYLAGLYMIGPAIAAIITRCFFHDKKFKDARLAFGKVKYYLYAWCAVIGIVLLSYLIFTAIGSISWDFSGETFLIQLKKQMADSGKDINDLPEGMTPKTMLILFFIGGLTLFNIPTILAGFGEEFGWRGFMFPELYRIKPWVGFVVGGLIWFAWHTPLLFVIPNTTHFTAYEHIANIIILSIGSICTFIFFSYIYVRAGNIWVPSFAHAVLNNASRSFSYFTKIENQLMANLGLTATMILVVLVLYIRKDFRYFKIFFSDNNREDKVLSKEKT